MVPTTHQPQRLSIPHTYTMTVINLPQPSGHKPAPATYHAPLVHFPPYNPELDFDFDDDEEDDAEDLSSPPASKPRSQPISITIVPSMQPKRTRSRTRATQSLPSSPRPASGFAVMQRRETTSAGRPSMHHRGTSVSSSSSASSPELSTASVSPSSLPKASYFYPLHGRFPQQPVQRKPSYAKA